MRLGNVVRRSLRRQRRLDTADGGASKAENAESREKRIYQILLMGSLVLNGGLALRTQWSSERAAATDERMKNVQTEMSRLQSTKLALDLQVLRAREAPRMSITHFRYNIPTLRAQINARQLVPYFEKLQDSRIVQNEIFDRIDVALSHDRGTAGADQMVTFLVIQNTGGDTASSIVATLDSGRQLPLGSVSPKAAVLIPIRFTGPGDGGDASPGTIVSRLIVQSPLGTETVDVPPPAAYSWVPAINNLKGVARAVVDNKDKSVRALVPDVKR